jgi:hypothetical protein
MSFYTDFPRMFFAPMRFECTQLLQKGLMNTLTITGVIFSLIFLLGGSLNFVHLTLKDSHCRHILNYWLRNIFHCIICRRDLSLSLTAMVHYHSWRERKITGPIDFMQPPLFFVHLQKKTFKKLNNFQGSLTAHKISGPYIMWRQFHSHHLSSCVRHVGIIDCQ